jgi:serine protease Do
VGALVGLLHGGGKTIESPARARAVDASPSFADIVEKVNPAVVHIAVLDGQTTNPHDDVEDAPDVEIPERGEGSGFVVDPAGYILTNHHLVPHASRIRVRLADKRELAAELVGSDPSTDLALLHVESGTGLPVVPLGDSDRLRVGDWVCAIGNPLHFEHTVTVGVVSSKGRKIFDLSFDNYIQTDAAINPGNSGGPLINAAGEVVGINAAVSSEGQGIGFAVPINLARAILDQLKTRGHVSRGYLGIQLQELDPELQKLVGLKEARGAMVLDVIAGGAGEAAGLKRYDVVTAVSGQPISDGDQLIRTISALPPGSQVALRLVRNGQEVAVSARLAERNDPQEQPSPAPVTAVSRKGDSLGLVVGEFTARLRSDLGVPADKQGVVVKEVVGLDPGADGIDRGDLIVEVNRTPTRTLAEYKQVLAALKPGEVAWLYVYRPRPAGVYLTRIETQGLQ